MIIDGRNPWLVTNKDKGYNFYCAIVDECDAIEYADYYVPLRAFTTNEFIFKEYLKFYSSMFEKLGVSIFEPKNITWDEFVELISKETDETIMPEHFITLDYIELIDSSLCITAEMSESIYEDISQYDILYEYVYGNLSQAYALFNEESLYFKEDFDIINKLLNRVYKSYIPLLTLSEYYDSGNWLDNINSEDKLAVTKILDFPKAMDEYSFYDIYCEDYIILIILNDNGTISL